MPSNNTTGKSRRRAVTAPVAITPLRSHGKARVAALLEAAAEVIAGKGYDDATMAEIAARAKSPIGSLYRFFPSKEVLANALIGRYAIIVQESFDALDNRVRGLPAVEAADALLDFILNLRSKTRPILGLLNARAEWSVKRVEFRNLALKRLAATLRLYAPKLPRAEARDIAVILLHNMKTMAALKLDKNIATSPGAINELRHMNRLYLVDRLGRR